jgi:heparosan-N-sulfate-glucuronate 5-epimerase
LHVSGEAAPKSTRNHFRRVARLFFVGFAVVAAPADAAPVHATRYNPAGLYVGPAADHSSVSPPEVILGLDGVPLVRYPGIGYHKNPVTIAQYGLWAYGAYLNHRDAQHRQIALHVADWLVTNQNKNRWFYDFNYTIDGASLKKPWASAMAQGQAMSLLERAYRLTGDQRYRRTALRALVPLQANVNAGGLRRCFFGNCTRPFFEEYPSDPPSYVLNGFMFTLIGLYDLASIAPKSKARSTYSAGRATLVRALRRYDIEGLASYDLTHVTVQGRTPTVAPSTYQGIHVYLLRALDSLTPDARLRHYADRWEANAAHAARARQRRQIMEIAALAVVAIAIVIGLGRKKLWRHRTRAHPA